MSENFIKFCAKISRGLPDFRGKFRIGMFLLRTFTNPSKWKNPEFFITLKNKSKLLIDLRSEMHLVPFWTGNRDQEIISLITKNIKRDWVIFDVGANIGCYAIPIGNFVKKLGGTVHAFEPFSSNFNGLKQAIEKNQLEDVVVANSFALGNVNGEIDIVKTEEGNSGNAVLSFNDSEYEKNMDKETIPIMKVDKYFKDVNLERCDFVKIDIEGAEYFFMEGAQEFLSTFKPVIYGEFNAFFMDKFGYSLKDIWTILEPLGYTPFVESRVKKGTFTPTEIKDGLVDLLFLPPGSDASDWIN